MKCLSVLLILSLATHANSLATSYVILPCEEIRYSSSSCTEISALINSIDPVDIRLNDSYLKSSTSVDGYTQPCFEGFESGEGEWPRILGNANRFLDVAKAKQLQYLLNTLDEQDVKCMSSVERCRFQNELWDVFDELVKLDGSSQSRGGLLKSIARVIWKFRISKTDLENIGNAGEGENPFPLDTDKYHKYYVSWRNEFSFHELAYSKRRYSIISFCVPNASASGWNSRLSLNQMIERSKTMPSGTVSFMDEYILNIGADLKICDSSMAVVKRRKVYGDSTKSNLPGFSMALLLHRKMPIEWALFSNYFPTWSRINMPTIPSAMKPAFLAPQFISCNNCHGMAVASLSSSYDKREVDNLELREAYPSQAVNRLIASKTESPEFVLLRNLVNSIIKDGSQ